MKKTLLIAGVFLTLDGFSQTPDSVFAINGGACTCTIKKREESVIFDKIQNVASFPGGEKAWIRFVGDSLGLVFRERTDAKEFQMKFVVRWDGSVSDIRTISVVDEEKIKEAKRIILLSGKWCPGLQNGYCETSYRTISFKF